MIKKYYILLFAIFLIAHLNAQTPIEVRFDEKYEIKIVKDKLHALHNPTSSEFQQIIIDTSFSPLKSLYPNYGFSKADTWFRFVLKRCDHSKNLYLRFSNPNLDEIDIYQSSKNYQNPSFLGDKRPDDKRAIQNRVFVCKLTHSHQEYDTILFRVNNGGEQFHFVPSIVTTNYFTKVEPKMQLIFGIYFGIILFIVIFNLFSYFSLGERTALWYALYAFSLGMLQVSLNGFGNQYFWSGEYFSNRGNPFFASTGLLFLLFFVTNYLKTKEYAPKIHLFLFISLVSTLCCVLLSVLPFDFAYEWSVIGINAITLILNVLIIPIAVFLFRKTKLEQVKLFILAFSVLIVCVFAFILKNFGILPSNFFTDNGILIGSSLESILLSIGIVLKYKSTREEVFDGLQKLNQVTEEANVQLEIKVEQRTREVEKQKEEISQKNFEIVSSIQYAKRIQEALIPSKSEFKRLFPSAVVWYAPKDIVAGDFYWVREWEIQDSTWHILVVADCTGHGVPGAMMSVLCMNSLEQAVLNAQLVDSGNLMDKTAEILVKSLENEDNELLDGMDASLLLLNPKTHEIKWTGANNALYIYRNESQRIDEISPDKKPVGKTDIQKVFTTHAIEVKNKDRIILFTDGYSDQFGGDKLKKMKRKTFQEQIIQSSHLAIQEQILYLEAFFNSWKGTEEQVDDVCIAILEV
jgi:serine phosphatase RsbU (regulator of sigma subunit)